MNWTLLITLVIAVFALSLIYLTASVCRFGLFRKIRNRLLRALCAFGAVALGVLFCTLAMSFVNAVIVFLHVTLFFLLSALAFRIVRRVTKRTFRVFWQGWCALAAAAVFLTVGFFLCFRVTETDYTLHTDKLAKDLKIAVLSDAHIGTTFDGEGFAAHIRTICEQSPDLVLIPGDFVDDGTDRADMIRACAALGEIDAPYGVWFAYGNHDKGYYRKNFSGDELERELEKNGVGVLEDEIVLIEDLCIVGRADAGRRSRKELSELLEGVDPNAYIVVMDHQPCDYEKESATAADLVVSGHTHGGQLFPVNRAGEWLGVNDRTYGYERRGNVDFIVTSGISDWELYFKTGTRSEYVMIFLSAN